MSIVVDSVNQYYDHKIVAPNSTTKNKNADEKHDKHFKEVYARDTIPPFFIHFLLSFNKNLQPLKGV